MTNKRRLSFMLLCLAGACAHGKASSEQASSAHDNNAARVHQTEPDSRAGQDPANERVELPDTREGKGRIATTGAVPESAPPSADQPPPNSAAAYGGEADNTRVNERDRSSAALTPMDQSEEKGDRELTQRIRKAVIAADSLSFSAKNVKIITREGQVTLRGSVKSQAERTTIEQLAKDAAGAGRVTNQLEVAD